MIIHTLMSPDNLSGQSRSQWDTHQTRQMTCNELLNKACDSFFPPLFSFFFFFTPSHGMLEHEVLSPSCAAHTAFKPLSLLRLYTEVLLKRTGQVKALLVCLSDNVTQENTSPPAIDNSLSCPQTFFTWRMRGEAFRPIQTERDGKFVGPEI